MAQCPDNPHGCARRGGATGGSVGVDQSLLDYAVEVGVPMLEEQLACYEKSKEVVQTAVAVMSKATRSRKLLANSSTFRVLARVEDSRETA